MHPDEEDWDTEPIYCQYECYATGTCTGMAGNNENDNDGYNGYNNGNDTEGMSLID
jgi:hypothetical protein